MERLVAAFPQEDFAYRTVKELALPKSALPGAHTWTAPPIKAVSRTPIKPAFPQSGFLPGTHIRPALLWGILCLDLASPNYSPALPVKALASPAKSGSTWDLPVLPGKPIR